MKHNAFLEGTLWEVLMSVQDVVGSGVLLNYLQETTGYFASQANESHQVLENAMGLSTGLLYWYFTSMQNEVILLNLVIKSGTL